MSKYDKSREVSSEQDANIKLISVTLDVFRFSMPSMDVKFEQPLNHAKHVVGWACLNDASKTTFVRDLLLVNQPGSSWSLEALFRSYTVSFVPASGFSSYLNVRVLLTELNTA